MPVSGWEGLYEVSNRGRFKTIERFARGGHRRKQPIHVRESVRTHSSKSGDYLQITFCKRPKTEIKLAHRVVASHFIPNPYNKPQVNHINGNKQDNRACNLEWVTEQENTIHAFKLGLKRKTTYREKLSDKTVLEIFNSPFSLSRIASQYNVPKLTVQAIKSGKRYGRVTLKPYYGKNGRAKIYGKT